MDFSAFEPRDKALIKVIGVGGGGGNAVNNMVSGDLDGVTFIVANTDNQALKVSQAQLKVQLGAKLTRGLGAGAKPEVGEAAAEESIEEIRNVLKDCDMIFITAGMGGGTGTGAAPVVARIAKEMEILTVGVVTKPFYYEGNRSKLAEAGINKLKQYVDSLIVIPNDRLLSIAGKNAKMLEVFQRANEVLANAVRGISDLVLSPGYINLDFADLRSVMSEQGMALMGTGSASGEGRAKEAAIKAITNPLLEDVRIDGARGVLVNVTSNADIAMEEMNEVGRIIHESVHADANVFIGSSFDHDMGDEIKVTVIATGLEGIESDTIKVESHNNNVTPIIKRDRISKWTQGQQIQSEKKTENLESINVRKRQESLSHKHNLEFDDAEFEIPAFIRSQAD